MNISQIRSDIDSIENKLFFNSASSSLPVKSVTQKVIDYLKEEHQIGGYKASEIRENEIRNFYVQASKLLNCNPENIAFAYNSTNAYYQALSSVNFKKGDVVITSDDDYVSNHLQFLTLKKRVGIQIQRIRTDEKGDLDINHFKKLVEEYKPKLVAVTHVPTNSGLIQDVESIGEICNKNNILFLLDACQSVGQIDVDVQKIQCDFLVVTGRKWLRSPRGTGILYVSNKVLNKEMHPMSIDANGALWTSMKSFELEKTAKRFELFESSKALIVGFAEGLRYLNSLGIQNIEARNQQLISRLRGNLHQIKDVELFDKGSRTSNILTFRKNEKSLDQIQRKLDENDVYYSVSSKHWALIDFKKKNVDWVVRLSPHYFNTEEEIDKVSEIIASI